MRSRRGIDRPSEVGVETGVLMRTDRKRTGRCAGLPPNFDRNVPEAARPGFAQTKSRSEGTSHANARTTGAGGILPGACEQQSVSVCGLKHTQNANPAITHALSFSPSILALQHLRGRLGRAGVSAASGAVACRTGQARPGSEALRPEAEGAAPPAEGESDDLAFHAGRAEPC